MRTGKSSGAARVALCGVFGALALALMLMGGILPAATFAAPAFALRRARSSCRKDCVNAPGEWFSAGQNDCFSAAAPI